MISVNKIKENIKCPQFGDLNYGKWGTQKLEIREALKFMCDLYDSMDSIIKQQKENIIKEIRDKKEELMYLASKCSTIYRNNIEVVAIYDRLKELFEILDKGE